MGVLKSPLISTQPGSPPTWKGNAGWSLVLVVTWEVKWLAAKKTCPTIIIRESQNHRVKEIWDNVKIKSLVFLVWLWCVHWQFLRWSSMLSLIQDAVGAKPRRANDEGALLFSFVQMQGGGTEATSSLTLLQLSIPARNPQILGTAHILMWTGHRGAFWKYGHNMLGHLANGGADTDLVLHYAVCWFSFWIACVPSISTPEILVNRLCLIMQICIYNYLYIYIHIIIYFLIIFNFDCWEYLTLFQHLMILFSLLTFRNI